jgi:hypothetical protein
METSAPSTCINTRNHRSHHTPIPPTAGIDMPPGRECLRCLHTTSASWKASTLAHRPGHNQCIGDPVHGWLAPAASSAPAGRSSHAPPQHPRGHRPISFKRDVSVY